MKKNPTRHSKGSYQVDGSADPKPHELMTAQALAKAGYRVRFLPNPTVIGTADVYIENTIFELKAPEGSTADCIERNLRKALDHQSHNIIVDSMRVKNMRDRSIQSFLIGRLRRGHGIERLIFVNRDREVIDINALA